MACRRPSFSLGIEEEYFLVDRDTRDVIAEPPASILAECRDLLHEHVVAEFLESQIEVSTGCKYRIANRFSIKAALIGTPDELVVGIHCIVGGIKF